MDHIVFYDGICGLCNRSVNWLIKHDRKRILRYASLQSGFSKKALQAEGLDITSGTIVFYDDQKIYTKSAAILKIFHRLGGIYRLAGIFYVLPPVLRDAIYDWIARNRYRWFGKYESCPMPDPGNRQLFIDS
jgi:predicted DCC family thiol-disulfide oxidoreductase YuxK